ncbi:hypothetical protein [Legionella worsleiensis]|uniref:Uncharacterized protein n=1 Tax=Legionella worsleiensis TaxID=45076 RepID=A0A0W1AL55_9GAMM|nr:hypothetical protein [Legionella worsleiensis]KTD82093.1 hypothetical protein Lwor_0013 [Legionella worsleiensis]STY31480.1 Uncharacterised protein [Legionella worsleiensis]
MSYDDAMDNHATVEKECIGKGAHAVVRLSHATLSRPVPPHRPPSRSGSQFFMNQSKIETSDEYLDFSQSGIDLIKKTLEKAIQHYDAHITNGEYPRHKSGWFTGWRHDSEGVEKAKNLIEQIKPLDSYELIFVYLSHFFLDEKTRYNNHSFSCYLLDELNRLLKHKPAGTASYDKFSWGNIAGELKKLCFDTPRPSSSVSALSPAELI